MLAALKSLGLVPRSPSPNPPKAPKPTMKLTLAALSRPSMALNTVKKPPPVIVPTKKVNIPVKKLPQVIRPASVKTVPSATTGKSPTLHTTPAIRSSLSAPIATSAINTESPTLHTTPAARPSVSKPTATPGLRSTPAQASAPRINDPYTGLTDTELTALITSYRGHATGLAGQSRRHLLVLLEHYEVCKTS